MKEINRIGIGIADCKYCDRLIKENEKLRSELEELRQVRKDLPDIQSPYVVLYRQIKEENEKLKKQLEIDKNQINYFKEENEKLKEEIKLIEKNADMYADLFNDEYFKDLIPEQVIELAKKSIRITAYNRELENTLEEIREKLKKYDANIGDTIIANPIQDCYDTYKLINEVLK